MANFLFGTKVTWVLKNVLKVGTDGVWCGVETLDSSGFL